MAPGRLFVVACAALASGCSPSLRDGWYACATTLECPSGYSCSGGRCHRGVGAECMLDVHCDDVNTCTLDACEGGLCLHSPESGPCDDGDFCNGADECRDGECVAVGPAQCMGSCDPVLGCTDCGAISQPCCPGDACNEGACDSGVCAPCGSRDELCCVGDFPCWEIGTSCGASGRCETCGLPGGPCCAFGECAPPSICLGATCGESPECAGTACPSGTVCMGMGNCVQCGGDMEPCCSDGCGAGLSCDFGSGLCAVQTCGAPGQPCCIGGRECGPDLACAGDATGGPPTCQPCGANAGDPCCPGDLCSGAGLACARGGTGTGTSTCEPCGGDGQPCCPPDAGGMPCPGIGNACVIGICHVSCGGPGEPCCSDECALPLACSGGNCGPG